MSAGREALLQELAIVERVSQANANAHMEALREQQVLRKALVDIARLCDRHERHPIDSEVAGFVPINEVREYLALLPS